MQALLGGWQPDTPQQQPQVVSRPGMLQPQQQQAMLHHQQGGAFASGMPLTPGTFTSGAGWTPPPHGTFFSPVQPPRGQHSYTPAVMGDHTIVVDTYHAMRVTASIQTAAEGILFYGNALQKKQEVNIGDLIHIGECLVSTAIEMERLVGAADDSRTKMWSCCGSSTQSDSPQ